MAQNITPELSEALQLNNTKGVIVTDIIPGSPASIAGLAPQDVILSVNNIPIYSAAQLHNTFGLTRPNSTVTLDLLRQHKKITTQAVVGDPSKPLAHTVIPYLSGLRLEIFSNLSPNNRLIKGALVISYKDSSLGALAGLLPGDIIVEAGGEKIMKMRQLISIAKKTKPSLLLKVARNSSFIYLVIQR